MLLMFVLERKRGLTAPTPMNSAADRITGANVFRSGAMSGFAHIERMPVDSLLAFHLVFGKTVPDISLNAVANLGYAECRFHQPGVPGDETGSARRSRS